MIDDNATSRLGTAVVTGASSGIGATYADRLARRGYDLVLVARRQPQLDEVARSIRETHGVTVETIVADLASKEGLARVAARIAGNDAITMLVNNAGTSTFVPVFAVDPIAADAMTDLNITALVHLTLAVLPGFRSRNAGTIVNIASIAALGEMPGSAFYSGTKAYVVSFTRGLAAELGDSGIRVQAVLPAPTATEGWDKAGIPLASLDPATVMSVEDCVDSALAGLDQGETITLPSVENAPELLGGFDAARFTLLGASQTSAPATRYRTAG